MTTCVHGMFGSSMQVYYAPRMPDHWHTPAVLDRSSEIVCSSVIRRIKSLLARIWRDGTPLRFRSNLVPELSVGIHLTLMRSMFTSFRSRSATAITAFTQISAIWRFKRPTLRRDKRMCPQGRGQTLHDVHRQSPSWWYTAACGVDICCIKAVGSSRPGVSGKGVTGVTLWANRTLPHSVTLSAQIQEWGAAWV